MTAKTSAERQASRQERLNQIAQKIGFTSWRFLETAVLKGEIEMKRTINGLAAAIYNNNFGHLDDKVFADQKTTEIADWLSNGDLHGDETIEQLTDEWREYDNDPNIIS